MLQKQVDSANQLGFTAKASSLLEYFFIIFLLNCGKRLKRPETGTAD
jgi:hypothetical protein